MEVKEFGISDEVFEKIKIGDFILINDWEDSLRVVGISTNYIVLFDKNSEEYSVICKNKRTKHTHNEMIEGTYCCGPDDRLFGYFNDKYEHQYDFNNPEWVQDYLMAFANGELNISEKQGCTIHYMKIWHEDEVFKDHWKGEL